MSTLYHGGIAGLQVGHVLVPSDPHMTDGCPVCVARAEGRVCTVLEFRRWLLAFPPSEKRDQALAAFAGQPNDAPVDPPSEQRAVYVTTSLPYARWYAARSGHGDLYSVDPIGPRTRSETDPFPTWTCEQARVVRVIARRVFLSRRERRELDRLWRKADKRAALFTGAA